jgi:hypothetical protein
MHVNSVFCGEREHERYAVNVEPRVVDEVHVKNGTPALIQDHLQILDPDHVIRIVGIGNNLLRLRHCSKQQQGTYE